MIDKIKKTISFTFNLNTLLKSDIKEADLFQYFTKINSKKTPAAKTVIALQCVEDPFYFSLFGQIVSSMREKKAIQVHQNLIYSLRLSESLTFGRFFFTRISTNILKIKWKRLYNSFCDKTGYNVTGLNHPINDIIDLFKSYKCWKQLKNKNDLIQLKINNLPVGDLINDAFLRFKPAPTVEFSAIYLWMIIWQAHMDIRCAKKYFSRVKPKLYLTSYSTYIQHGIPVRVALEHGVPVFAVASNRQEFAKQLVENDWVHTKNPDNYANDFLKLNESDKRLAAANKALTQRMDGIIDTSTSYMKKSAYDETNTNVPDVKGAVILFLHDFFDSPHVYRNMVFPDFWEWACFTIDTLEQAGIKYFVKPHPNQIGLSNNVITQLKGQYPNLLLIPPDITNKQLVKAGMVCAITVYGTVASEMAFLGIPTIGSANHPHISFDFCITAKNMSEYGDLLRKSTNLEFDKLKMKQQSLAFYYMHNLNVSDDEKELNDAIASFADTAEKTESELSESIKDISQLPGYNNYISRLLAIN